MVSFRYHVVSLGVALLALAAGVVLGAGPLSSKVNTALAGPAPTDTAAAAATVAGLRARVVAGDAYVAATAKTLVTGQLRKTRIVLVLAPGTPPALATAVTDLLGVAGATVTGSVSLTQAWSDPGQATVLNGITTQLAPAATAATAGSPGAQAAAALAAALLTKSSSALGQPSDSSTALLAGLVQGGFLTRSGQPDRAASLAVLLAPATITNAVGLLPLMTALDQAGKGAVVASGSGSAASGRVIGVLRGYAPARALVSGVDSVDIPAGRVALVLALAQQKSGGHGQYGSGPGADSPVPRR
jgi:Copper transport outer membrane protein, MctB